MRFLVPQFIDVEDKIVGPLTLKQGIYLIGAAGIVVILYLKMGLFFAFVLGGPVAFLAFLLAFVKVHGRPFIEVLASAFFFFTKNKLYLWKKTEKKKMRIQEEKTDELKSTSPVSAGMTQSRLKKLAWSLDTENFFDKK